MAKWRNPMRPAVAAVTVEYDAAGARKTKTFTDNHEARRFFAAKLKAGKNPKVVSAAVEAG